VESGRAGNSRKIYLAQDGDEGQFSLAAGSIGSVEEGDAAHFGGGVR